MQSSPLVGAFALAFLASCGGNPPPEPPGPPPPPCPVPDAPPTVLWRTPDQVELSWADMPVPVRGGAEDCVLRREAVVELPAPRTVTLVETFLGFDRGDIVEAETSVYDDGGRVIYRRSLHKESGDPDCYEAYEARAYAGPSTENVTVHINCRVNGANEQNGQLSARCHHLATLTLGPGGGPPPPPPGCRIPASEDPDWRLLGQPRTTRAELEAAKAAVGDRTGRDPLETLALLAAAVNAAGGCAVGPWDDEVAIRRSDGHVDGWHAVSFGSGGYTGDPKGDAWAHGALTACGDPQPPPLDRWNLKREGILPKWTAGATPLVRDPAYCAAIGYTDGRIRCPVRPEDHPEREACEALVVGAPGWSTTGGTCSVRPNPFLYRCNDDAIGHTVTVCASKAPDVCASLEVTKE